MYLKILPKHFMYLNNWRLHKLQFRRITERDRKYIYLCEKRICILQRLLWIEIEESEERKPRRNCNQNMTWMLYKCNCIKIMEH